MPSTYSEYQKQAIYKWRTSHAEEYKASQREYQRANYYKYKDAVNARSNARTMYTSEVKRLCRILIDV